MKSLRFDVFGRDVAIIRTADGWQAFYLGSEGKRRIRLIDRVAVRESGGRCRTAWKNWTISKETYSDIGRKSRQMII